MKFEIRNSKSPPAIHELVRRAGETNSKIECSNESQGDKVAAAFRILGFGFV